MKHFIGGATMGAAFFFWRASLPKRGDIIAYLIAMAIFASTFGLTAWGLLP